MVFSAADFGPNDALRAREIRARPEIAKIRDRLSCGI
jgi:hypothetical protein